MDFFGEFNPPPRQHQKLPLDLDLGDLDNPLLSGYLSDQLNPVQSAKTDAHVACSSAERRSSDSTWSYSDAPDYNPGMNNPAELVPPALVSENLITGL